MPETTKPDPATVDHRLELLERQVAILTAENKALKEVNSAPNAPIAEEDVIIKLPSEPILFNKEKYQFVVAKFVTKDGKTLTALDASTDEKIIKDLIQSGSGVLKKI